MVLENLHLLQFKNYTEADVAFSSHINCFIGDNGSGKTNLLDAIHYLSLTKSAFTGTDLQNIKEGDDFFVVRGRFLVEDKKDLVQVTLQAGQKKVVLRNKVPYERVSEHVGRFPVVLISPYDTDIIREGSEMRRRFFDSLISQLYPEYLDQLLRYNRVLKQRNSFLKQQAGRNNPDLDFISVLDEQLVPLGEALVSTRRLVLSVFEPIFQKHYQNLSGEREQVKLIYQSKLLETGFSRLLHDSLRKDLILQRTTTGPHKDDFVFLMDERPVKQFGSQGQQKSYAIALKLAQFELIAEHQHHKPLLLLDDIFDRLDQSRISKLLEMVAQHQFGQIFLTDTDLSRTRQTLEGLSEQVRFFHVKQGEVKLLDC